MLRSFRFLRETISNSGDFIIKDTTVNISFFRMEVFVKCCTNNTIVVNTYTVLLQEEVSVSIVSMIRKRERIRSDFLGEDLIRKIELIIFQKEEEIIIWGGR